MDYERLGFTREEERLLNQLWNYGQADRALGAARVLLINGSITALLVHGVATGTLATGVVGAAWIVYNTTMAAVAVWRDAPRWRGTMTKLEALLRQLPESQGGGGADDAA